MKEIIQLWNPRSLSWLITRWNSVTATETLEVEIEQENKTLIKTRSVSLCEWQTDTNNRNNTRRHSPTVDSLLLCTSVSIRAVYWNKYMSETVLMTAEKNSKRHIFDYRKLFSKKPGRSMGNNVLLRYIVPNIVLQKRGWKYVWPWLLSKVPWGPRHINRRILQHIAEKTRNPLNKILSVRKLTSVWDDKSHIFYIVWALDWKIVEWKNHRKRKLSILWDAINVAVNWFEFFTIGESGLSAFEKTACYLHNEGVWIDSIRFDYYFSIGSSIGYRKVMRIYWTRCTVIVVVTHLHLRLSHS